MRGADALAQTLSRLGCKTIFALSGNQIMPIFDACLDAGIRLVHTRHEAATGYMAEGFAQVTGQPGVALVTAGAGLGNAIAPLITAHASQTPLILLSGDSPTELDGRGAFQEMDQVALTRSLTKLSRRLVKADDIAKAVEDAWATATEGQPGPVHLSLPVDVLEASTQLATPQSSAISKPEPDVRPIVEALCNAERPLIILGPSLRGSVSGLSNLNVPVVTMESPRGARDPSLGRLIQTWPQCDLVVVLGKSVDFTLGFGEQDVWPQAKWVFVHSDEAEHQRASTNLGERMILSVKVDPRTVAMALEPFSAHMPERLSWQAKVSKCLGTRIPPTQHYSALTSQTVCAAVERVMPSDAVLVCDGGEFGQWAQTVHGASRRIVNGVSGAIGGGLCQAIGAKAGMPDTPVYALMGDGTVGFHLPEFETAVRAGLPFVAVIGNDRLWNAEHQIQHRVYGKDRLHSCSLSGARYDLAVEALGGFGEHVTNAGELDGALARALDSGLPACVNVEITGLPAPIFD